MILQTPNLYNKCCIQIPQTPTTHPQKKRKQNILKEQYISEDHICTVTVLPKF
jgi:hypothetical protein